MRPIDFLTYDQLATTLWGPQTSFQPVSAYHNTDSSRFFSYPHGQDARSTGGENIMGGDVGGDAGDVGDVGAPL